VGLLATIALVRFARVQEDTYTVSMISDLRRYAYEQEAYRADGIQYASDPEQIPGFYYSTGVSRLSSTGGAARWSLAVRHEKTEVTCGLAIGDGVFQDGQITCAKPHAIDFEVSTRSPAEGDTVVFDASHAVAVIESGYSGVGVSAKPMAARAESTGAQLLARGSDSQEGPEVVSVRWFFDDGTETVGDASTHATIGHVFPARSEPFRVHLEIVTKHGVRFHGQAEIQSGTPGAGPPPAPEPPAEEEDPAAPSEPADEAPDENPSEEQEDKPIKDPIEAELPADTLGGGPVASFRVLPESQIRVWKKVKFKAEGWDARKPKPKAYVWNMGDGAICQGDFPEHHYDAAGQYLVVLSVEYPDGYVGHAQQRITVQENHDQREPPKQPGCPRIR
jgi:hypothetical protein